MRSPTTKTQDRVARSHRGKNNLIPVQRPSPRIAKSFELLWDWISEA